jgi:uncharacterized membrane protein YhhN
MVGDAFLVHPAGLTISAIFFALAHLCYIRAFGFKVMRLPIGIALYTFLTAFMILLRPGIPDMTTRNVIHMILRAILLSKFDCSNY